MADKQNRTAQFRMVEVLFVVAVVGVLFLVLIPAIQTTRSVSRRNACADNLKMLGLGLHNYHDTYRRFPPATIWLGNPKGTQSSVGDQRNYTWSILILPFLYAQASHDSTNFSMPAHGQVVHVDDKQSDERVALQSLHLDIYMCPSDLPNQNSEQWGYSFSSYAGNAGWDGRRRSYGDRMRAGPFSLMDSVNLSDFKDGTTNTILLGEVTNSGFCCRPKSASPWSGGSGKIRPSLKSRVIRTATVADAAWVHNSEWVLAAKQGELRRADGSRGGIWAHSSPHLIGPVYYSHYAMNVEWQGAGSRHPGGAMFTLGDASVRFISEEIETGEGDDRGRNGNIWVAAHTYMGDSVQKGAEVKVVWP